MLRDVFYYGQKPNAHPREKFAVDLVDARNQSTTEHFWIINEFCDYRNFEWDFDFEFLPDEDVWAKDHNNIWPSQHQKDSGTWLCAKQHSEINIYRCDVEPVIRKNIKSDNWVILDNIDESKFDFSWHPDPTDPPFIYKWGSKFFPPELKHVVEYQTPNATNSKYMEKVVELSVSSCFLEVQKVKENSWIKTWRPDPMDPPFIYVWGNKYIPGELKSTVEYHAPGANSVKYMPELLEVEPEYENWIEYQKIDKTKFDLSWRPDPREPAYIYVWGNKYISGEAEPTLEYHAPGATDKKYMGNIDVLPEYDRWLEHQKIDKTKFDLSWRPDPSEPPFIYVWGNKYIPAEIEPTLEYRVPGATDKKYMGYVDVLPQENRWVEVQQIDKTKFDLSWRPDPREPAYIYVWGNEYIPGELQSTLEYRVPGAVDKKYMGNVDVLPQSERWIEHQKVDKSKFNFVWRPDLREPPYIYVWGNIYTPGETEPTLEYHVPGATDKKYMGIAPLEPEWDRWKIYDIIDKSKFDLSWRPDPNLHEPPYIYVWGNKYVPGEIQPTLEYYVPGATDKKYMGNVDVLPQSERWIEHQKVDKIKFDFSWRPDPLDPPYIYIWGNKYTPGEREATLEYHAPNATDKKYMGIVPLEPEWDRWKIHTGIDASIFDFSWRPDPNLHEPPYIYVWGNKYIPGEVEPTLEYHVPGATDKKYMGDVEVTPEWEKYKVLVPVDKTKFDFTWRPDPREPAYIYVWGNQHNKAEIEPTIEYYVPGATARKYMDNCVATTLPIIENWKILIPVENFDYSWRPDPGSPPYIYVFGNQWHDAVTEPTLEYHVPGATDKKYTTDIIAQVSPMLEYWNKLLPVENFDYSWRPNPHDPPYVYVFGNQWYDAVKEPTLEYHVPGATDKKYVTEIIAYVKPSLENYKQLLDIEKFDYSWHPDPNDPPYIYVFGNQWHDAVKEPTLEYHVTGAVDKKYIQNIKAIVKADMKNWTTNYQVENFDYSWRPDPDAPPMIYQFGTVLDDIHLKDGPIYTVPENDGTIVYLDNKVASKAKINYPKYYIKTTLENLIKEHPNEIFWALRENINYKDFNFDWTPTKENVFHINVFGSPSSEITQTYFVNSSMISQGYTQKNYLENVELDDEYLSALFKPMDMFYIDRGNNESNSRFEQLKEKFPNIQKTRFLNTWVNTISRCLNKCTTELCWILNSELDYTDFNFEFYPNPWQLKMIHVFGTQWSHWGTTFVVNKEKFNEDTKYVKVIEHLSNINFVKKSKAFATNCLYDVYLIDHGNKETDSIYESLKGRLINTQITVVKYDKSYLQTFKNLLATLIDKKEHYIWICSSICDYTSFDFSYICDPFAKEQLHVFPSDKQKFGDTFLIDVNKLRSLVSDMQLLDDYEKINFNQHQRVKRLVCPLLINESDTLTESVNVDFDFPYALVKTFDNQNIKIDITEPPTLWSEETNTITLLSEGGTNIFLPKIAKNYVKKELYDFPYISKPKMLINSNPLDIVFLSNGEPNADENYEYLLKVTKNLPNRVVRVDKVNGRVQSYHAAANASNTPWFFTVFAKLKINNKFNFNWQPDRLQAPKHYIFKAINPVNGLIYGHQAMIAYNKKITLENTGIGLDFTLDNEHEVVDLISGVANFDTDPWSTWRTAFREVIKLLCNSDKESLDRLDAWMNVANGFYAKYSLDGARDAVEYFTDVNGDIEKLKLSYEWKWLNEYFTNKYKL